MSLAQQLARDLGRRHVVLAGRGATALYLALRTLPGRGRRVVLPDILCASPANVTLYAGLEPLFCDVDPATGNLDPAAFARLLAAHDDIAAVVPVHLYGQPARIGEIARLAAARGVAVVEDAAQAVGGSLDGRPLGAWGDVSIISFGHTKTIDVGWGGAVLTDDDAWHERLVAEAAQLPPPPADLDRQYAEYRRLYYGLRALAGDSERLQGLLMPLPELFRPMHLFTRPPEREAEIARCWPQLEDRVRRRRACAESYRRRLEPHGLQLVPLAPGGAPWRVGLLAPPGLQAPITEALRAARLDASNWYPPLHACYAAGRAPGAGPFPAAVEFAGRIVNLWNSPEIGEDYVEKACATILRTVKGERA